MAKGISLGIGITLGFIITIFVIGFIIISIIAIYKFSLRNKFSKNLFRSYRKELLQDERFEELSDVNEIIAQFKKNEKLNKEILQKYKVDVDTYLYWSPTYEGGDRLVFVHDKRIMKKKTMKKEDKEDEENNKKK